MRRIALLVLALVVVVLPVLAVGASRPIAFVPTGTGLVKVASGTESAAAALLTDSDVAANAAISTSKIAACSAHTVIKSTTGSANACAAVDLAADVSGVLGAAYGGMGANVSALSGVVKASGGAFSAASVVDADVSSSAAIAVAKLAPASSDGRFLVTTGGVATWAASNAAWVTAYDHTFTSDALVTATGNGSFSIGGDTWTVQNFANASVMSVGGASGLRVKANTVNSTNTPPTRSGPCFTSPALSTWITLGDTSTYAIRVSAYAVTQTLTTANDASDVYLDTSDSNQRYEVSAYNKAGTRTDYARLLLANASKMSADVGASLASHDSFQLEIPYLGADLAWVRSGIYSAGWPAQWKMRATIAAASGAWVNPLLRTLSDAHVSLCVETGNTSGTAETKWGRLRVEYRPNG